MPSLMHFASAAFRSSWEDSTRPVEEMGVRRVIFRSAIVLNKRDGILPIMMLPVKLFAGGRLGSGRQYMSWIHEKDFCRAVAFVEE